MKPTKHRLIPKALSHLKLHKGILTTLILVLCHAHLVYGLVDDPGIHKARLIQQNDSTYIFQVDVSQKWLWAIKAPVLPERFQVSEQTFVPNGNWYVAQVTIISNGKALNSNDVLFLPWGRNGVDLTAIWLDGSVHKGLFLRDLSGITVPLNQLLPKDADLGQLITEHVFLAVKQFGFHLLFILLALAITVYFGADKFKGIILLGLGLGTSVILSEFGLFGLPLLYLNIITAALISYLCYLHISKTREVQNLHATLLIYGLLLGLSYHQELRILDLDVQEKSIATFVFTCLILMGVLFISLIGQLILKFVNAKILSYTIGSLGISIMIVLFHNYVQIGQLDILNLSSSAYIKNLSLPLNENDQATGSKPVGKAYLSTPIMSYLSIEPYEVRHELLINARSAVQLLGVNDEGMAGIPIGSLESVKDGIRNTVLRNNQISIDSTAVTPEIVNVDFVTLSASGVLIRDTPVRESLDEGIIGMTLIYETNSYPNLVDLQWNQLNAVIPAIETTSVDPFGTSTEVLTPNNTLFRWQNSLKSIPNNTISSIAVEHKKVPYVSYLLLLTLIILVLKSYKTRSSLIYSRNMLLLFALAVLCFPFLRFQLALPFLNQITPSKERSQIIIEQLLTNVYKSFEVRNEEKVYDRLALSVTGEKLTEIYLDNRKSLEFENRGGARANIDKVVINAIENIERIETDTFKATTKWLVSGSVGHFGHTHYRRNFYDAIITFSNVDGIWKIKDIELIEEKRLL